MELHPNLTVEATLRFNRLDWIDFKEKNHMI